MEGAEAGRDPRAGLVAFGRRLAAGGFVVGADGNLSVRTAGGMLITPSRVPYDTMRPEDVVAVDPAGGWADRGGPPPSSERAVHTAVYAARPEVGAVIHAHPLHATALAVLREPLPPLLDEVGPVLGGDVRVAAYAAAGDPGLGAAVTAALTGRHAVILANHGTVTVGADLAEALYRLEVLERAAAVYLVARAHGRVTLPG